MININVSEQDNINVNVKSELVNVNDVTKSYVDQQDTLTLNTSKLYTDDVSSTVLQEAKEIVDETRNGIMLSTDKIKLDNIQSGAEVNIQSNWTNNDITSDEYIKNKPNIPINLTDLSGILPIIQGGTGTNTVKGAQAFVKLFTDVTQLGLSYPCKTGDIVNAMPDSSIGFFGVEASASTVTDVPTGYSFLEIFRATSTRVRVLLNSSTTDGSGTPLNFNVGSYNSSTKTISSWSKLQTSAFATPINVGGTGATTASVALTNLGAQSSIDNNLLTTSKTIVGAINELYTLINP